MKNIKKEKKIKKETGMWGYKDLLATRIEQGEVQKEGVEKGEVVIRWLYNACVSGSV